MRVLAPEAHKMQLLHVVSTLLLFWNVSCSAVTIGIPPFSHPIQSLYHAQDVFGQYSYGYSTPTSSKSEIKTADGVTHGGYSYLDAKGILQSVRYFADPIHGFRVLATNLPQDAPEVAHAKAQHLLEFQATQAERAALAQQIAVAHAVEPVAVPVQDLPEVAHAKAQHLLQFQATKAEHEAIAAQRLNAPNLLPAVAPVQDLPEVVKARVEHLAEFELTKARDISLAAGRVVYAPHVAYSYVPAVHVPVSSQYHAQDGLGQYSYGYVSPLSSKDEVKTADGITRGGYSYIDANGIVQSIKYVSDPVNGFRVLGTNLPVAPQILLKGASSTAHIEASPNLHVVADSKPIVAEPIKKPIHIQY